MRQIVERFTCTSHYVLSRIGRQNFLTKKRHLESDVIITVFLTDENMIILCKYEIRFKGVSIRRSLANGFIGLETIKL